MHRMQTCNVSERFCVNRRWMMFSARRHAFHSVLISRKWKHIATRRKPLTWFPNSPSLTVSGSGRIQIFCSGGAIRAHRGWPNDACVALMLFMKVIIVPYRSNDSGQSNSSPAHSRGGATVCGDYSVIVAAGRAALNVQDCDLESWSVSRGSCVCVCVWTTCWDWLLQHGMCSCVCLWFCRTSDPVCFQKSHEMWCVEPLEMGHGVFTITHIMWFYPSVLFLWTDNLANRFP